MMNEQFIAEHVTHSEVEQRQHPISFEKGRKKTASVEMVDGKDKRGKPVKRGTRSDFDAVNDLVAPFTLSTYAEDDG